MTRDDAIKKIRKCMALARGATDAEAAAAMRQAQALMREHQLDDDGVELASVQEVETPARFKPILHWEAQLVMLIADAFGCEVISRHKVETRPHIAFVRVRYWVWIGVDAAPEVAGYAFEVLSGQCVKARLAHIGRQSKNCKPATKRARGDAFAAGWVHAVRALVDRFANGECNAELVKRHMAKNHPCLGSAKIKRRDEGRNVGDSAAHGYHAGKSATLHQGVGGLEERKLIAAAS